MERHVRLSRHRWSGSICLLGVNLFINIAVERSDMNGKRLTMSRMKKRACLGVILLLSVFMSGCLYVQVQDDVRHPDRIFRRARREIAQLQRRLSGVRPQRINVLLYDESDRQLITVRAPLQVAEACGGLDKTSPEAAKWGERCQFDWDEVRDLKHLGPGLLFEMRDEESRVLVWID